MKSLENAEIFYLEVKRVSPQLQNDLDLIKQRFTTTVKSKRRLSLITSFEDLVKVLIKRRYLDPALDKCIYWLDYICELYLGQSACQLHPTLPPVPQHSPQQSYIGAEHHRTHISHTNQAPSASARVHKPTLPPEIVDYLTKNISRPCSWKSLARELNVKEADITQLEMRYPKNVTACIREVLVLYIQEMPAPNQESILTRLEEALDKIDRQKLRLDVTAIARSLNSQQRM